MTTRFHELAELLVDLASSEKTALNFVLPLHLEKIVKGKGARTRLVIRATLRQLDGHLPKEKRARGDRAKRLAGQTQDKIIRVLVRQRKEELTSNGMKAGHAQVKAFAEVARLFGVSPGTIPDIMKGKSERERAKPKERRQYSRRKKSINRP